MRKISTKTIGDAVKKLCTEASQNLSPEVIPSLKQALTREKSETARQILEEIIKNQTVAKDDKLPLCQDTGMAVVFLEIGREAQIKGDLHLAINEGVKEGYKNLRKSMVRHPFDRKNTFDNTPPVVHFDFVPGDKIKIGLLPKGGGAENCSFYKMFLPTATAEEVVEDISAEVIKRAPQACPPIIAGIGMGGTFDYSAYLAKKALTRPLGKPSPDYKIDVMEKEIFYRINKSGIGPMGLGGNTTALAVHIETFPCHIASLPVAVNLECHSHRYREVII